MLKMPSVFFFIDHPIFVCPRARIILVCAVKDLSATEMRQQNVAVNYVVLRIFGFRYWQNVRRTREVYGYQSIK